MTSITVLIVLQDILAWNHQAKAMYLLKCQRGWLLKSDLLLQQIGAINHGNNAYWS
jgi:hypothetical protein